MTREEAIEILNRDDDSMRKGYFCINDFTAIEVLKSDEPCEDAISRSYALDVINLMKANIEADGYEAYSQLFDRFDNAPSVTPTHTETVTEFADRCRECGKQKKGKWNILGCDLYMCSNCYAKFTHEFNYCPNCYVEMEVEE